MNAEGGLSSYLLGATIDKTYYYNARQLVSIVYLWRIRELATNSFLSIELPIAIIRFRVFQKRLSVSYYAQSLICFFNEKKYRNGKLSISKFERFRVFLGIRLE